MTDHFRPESDLAWARTFSLGVDASVDALVEHGGSLYTVGYAARTRRGDGPDVDYNVLISRIDLSGAVRWTQLWEEPGDTWAWGAAATSQGIYICGTWEPTAGLNDPSKARGFVAKLDAHGQVVWRTEVGSMIGDWPSAITTHEDAVYVAGHAHGRVTGAEGNGSSNAFVVRIDTDGHLMWARQAGCGVHDSASAITVDADGIWVLGECRWTMLWRYSLEGELEFVRHLGADQPREIPSLAIIQRDGLTILGGFEEPGPPDQGLGSRDRPSHRKGRGRQSRRLREWMVP